MKHDYHRRLILIGWLFSALTVLYVSFCTWLPAIVQLPFLMLSCIFTIPLTMEFNVRGMVLQIIGVSAICALRYGIGVIAPYTLFLGYYPPIKFLCDQRGGIAGFLSKLAVYCFAFGIIIQLFPEPLFTAYTGIHWAVYIMLLLAYFIATDTFVSAFAAIYNSTIRKRLL